MQKVRIITDSNSGIKQSEGEKLGVVVISMPFTIDGEEFYEELTISVEEFYKYLENDADVKTSQPSQYDLEKIFMDNLKTAEEIVYIPMSSGLSGSYASAKRIAENFGGKIFVVDNERISITQKESVFEAIALAKMGKTGTEIKEYLEQTKGINSIYIMMGVLKYLKKGGRISPSASALGSMLNIKPILYSNGQNFEKFALAVTLTQAKKKMLAQVKKDILEKFKTEYENGLLTISVAHTQNQKEAEKFKEEIMKEFPNLAFRFVDELSLSVACHIGPGALAVCLSPNKFLEK